MRSKVSLHLVLCTLALLVTPGLLLAQATTSLGGRVTDASGAVIPGASVKLTLVTTGVSRVNTTTGNGEYQFSQLAPGRYTLDHRPRPPMRATPRRSRADPRVAENSMQQT